MDDAMARGLAEVAGHLAAVMIQVAALKTQETAGAVNVQWRAQEVAIRAGRPVGRYGWKPIQALMFDDNKRHPLFGNERYWYHEGWFSITGITLDLGLGEAMEKFTDEAVPALLDQVGL